jgi:hypothetical protein
MTEQGNAVVANENELYLAPGGAVFRLMIFLRLIASTVLLASRNVVHADEGNVAFWQTRCLLLLCGSCRIDWRHTTKV